MNILCKTLVTLALASPFLPLQAEESAASYELILKDHLFQPAELELPAGEKVKLVVKNQDATPEEFESRSLKREKIIPGNSQVVLTIGPLSAGTYTFFGDFHEATAKGRIIVK